MTAGYVDLDVTLRLPAAPDDEGEARLIDAAVAGQLTAMVVSVDGASVVDDVSARAMASLVARGRDAGVAVIPAIAPLRDGSLSDIALAEHALHDLGVEQRVWRLRAPIDDALLLRRVGDLAAARGAVVIVNGLDKSLSASAIAWESPLATRMGLPAMPEQAEAIGIARVVEIAQLTGATFHIAGVSTAAGALAIERAPSVTGSVHAASLLFDEGLHERLPYDTRTRKSPPVPLPSSKNALIDAVRRDVLMVSSGHRFVTKRERDVEFVHAQPGGTSLSSSGHMLRKVFGDAFIANSYAKSPAALLHMPAPELPTLGAITPDDLSILLEVSQ